jgi:hypothetical protein
MRQLGILALADIHPVAGLCLLHHHILLLLLSLSSPRALIT